MEYSDLPSQHSPVKESVSFIAINSMWPQEAECRFGKAET
jgi:hypothetical protein